MHVDPVTVLVVEDEALIRLAIADELEGAGFQVLEAPTADDAIALIEAHPEVQLVFTDIDMPGSMDGLKLAAFIRIRWPPVKIIVTSGRVIPDTAALPDDIPFLAKPYAFDQVVLSIRSLTVAFV